MRSASTYLVFTFDSTADALAFQAFCAQHHLPGRSIPVPASIHAGCGLAWKCDRGAEDATIQAAREKNAAYAAVDKVRLFD